MKVTAGAFNKEKALVEVSQCETSRRFVDNYGGDSGDGAEHYGALQRAGMRCGHHRELDQLLPGPILEIAISATHGDCQLGHYTRMVRCQVNSAAQYSYILYLNI